LHGVVFDILVGAGASLALAAPMAQGTARMMPADAAPSDVPATGPAGSAAIDVAHLVKLYKTTRAVDDVSFRIARGSITGLLGGNGAGKTTTIAMIMGLVLPTSGSARCSAMTWRAERTRCSAG
jgi:ABC-type glutathione transport system ATPase component